MCDVPSRPVNWRPATANLALFCAAAAYLAMGIRRPLNVYDEGLILHGAERLLLGERPYRDFWTVYAPGQYYVLGGLFKILGARVLVARVYDTLVRAALALASYRLARTLTSKPWALLVWLFEVAWLGFFEFYLYPTYPALLFCLLAILSLHQATQSGGTSRRRWWWIAGGFIGVAALFRHDFGAYQFVAAGVAGGIWAWRSADEHRGRFAKVWQALGRMAAGTALIAGPPYLALAAATGTSTLWGQLVRFPATVFGEVRALPYPRPTAAPLSTAFWEQVLAYLPYYLPVTIAIVALLWALRRLVQGRPPSSSWAVCGTLSLLALMLFQQARVRSDLIHNVQMLVVTPVLWTGLTAGLDQGAPTKQRWRAVGTVALLALLLAHPWRERAKLWQTGFPWSGAPASRIAKAYPAPVDPQLEQVALRIQDLTAPDERIYVGVGTHDRIFVNEPLLYFLADRPAGTRYHELHPGQATTRPVQQEIIADLERYQVHWIVISTRFDDVREPNASAISSGVVDLDQYIDAQFRLFAQTGPYRILSRRSRTGKS